MLDYNCDMKRILFDLLSAQPVGTSKFHGGGEYIKRVFKCLLDEFSSEIELVVFYDKDKFLDDWILEYIGFHKIKSLDVKKVQDIQTVLSTDIYDIFYTGIPYDYGRVVFSDKIRTIATFHGLRVLEKYTDRYECKYYNGIRTVKPLLKGLLSRIRHKQIYDWYWSSISNFRHIVCDSQHTQYAILSYFPEFDIKNLRTFYTPAKVSNKATISEDSDERAKYGKYILLIGMNRWEKNGYRAVIALDSLFGRQDLKDYKVVSVGRISPKVNKSIRHKDRFVFLDYVETDVLESLYANCDVFVYPSLNEGFGMPPLEAMRYGKTCVVSGVCSLPEIYGDAVYYVNPYDIKEMEGRILHALYEKKNEAIVMKQYEKIFKRQEEDLRKICQYIIGG